jgi:hypothetical protein
VNQKPEFPFFHEGDRWFVNLAKTLLPKSFEKYYIVARYIPPRT